MFGVILSNHVFLSLFPHFMPSLSLRLTLFNSGILLYNFQCSGWIIFTPSSEHRTPLRRIYALCCLPSTVFNSMTCLFYGKFSCLFDMISIRSSSGLQISVCKTCFSLAQGFFPTSKHTMDVCTVHLERKTASHAPARGGDHTCHAPSGRLV